MKWILLFSILFIAMVSCSRSWTEKDKEQFRAGCVQNSKKEMADEKALKYCQCMLEKIMKRYPDASRVQYIRYDTAVTQLAKECLKQQ